MAQLTSEQLHAGIKALAEDVVDAIVHWKLSRDIIEASERWPLVAQQSNTFWSLTVKAHVNLSVLAMCRVLDQEKSALHLLGLLQLIEKNIHLFSEENFRERKKANPFVASLLESARSPDSVQLAADIRLCSMEAPLVRKLALYRHTALAHLGRRRHLNGIQTNEDDKITDTEFEELLTQANEILNRYSSLFNAERFSTQIVGHDDYEIIFRWIQDRVERERSNRAL